VNKRLVSVVLLFACVGCYRDSGAERHAIPLVEASGVFLGMSSGELERSRPRVASDSDTYRERIGRDKLLLYWFGRHFSSEELPPSELVSVVLSTLFAPTDSLAVLRQADRATRDWSRRFGAPNQMPGRLIRRGNSVVELHVEWWETERTYLILTFEIWRGSGSPPSTLELTQTVQDKRLPIEDALPE
jgi:hypothetical protein